MRAALIAFLLLLQGCAAAYQLHNVEDITTFNTTVYIRVQDEIIHNGKEVKMLAHPGKTACLIIVTPKYYHHACLGHELRHCLEGYWHKGREVDC